MDDPRNLTLTKLADLRESLISFAKPRILEKLLDLCEALGTDRNSFVKQFKFWLDKNGPDCRYANMARQFFIQDQAESVANEINWLYHNWSKYYEEGK